VTFEFIARSGIGGLEDTEPMPNCDMFVTQISEEDDMALLEELFEDAAGPVIALGIGAIFLAPKLLPAAGRVIRPIAKGVIKTGMAVYEETFASVAEATGDLIAEARAELEAEAQHAAEANQEEGEAHIGLSSERSAAVQRPAVAMAGGSARGKPGGKIAIGADEIASDEADEGRARPNENRKTVEARKAKARSRR
jgi:Protein of unknown function (DUF5132)